MHILVQNLGIYIFKTVVRVSQFFIPSVIKGNLNNMVRSYILLQQILLKQFKKQI